MPPRRIPTKSAAPKEGTVKEISKEGAELEKLENKVGHQVGRCWLERSKYYKNKDYKFGLLLNLSSVWYLDSPEFLGIWSEDRSMTLHFTRKLLPTSPMLMIWSDRWCPSPRPCDMKVQVSLRKVWSSASERFWEWEHNVTVNAIVCQQPTTSFLYSVFFKSSC